MPGEAAHGRRTLWGLWLVAAAVVWNVSFDRQLSIGAARFAEQNVRAWQGGQTVTTVDAGYRSQIPRAIIWSSLAAGVVLAVGASSIGVTATRQKRMNGAGQPAR